MKRNYQEYLNRQLKHWGGKFDSSDLVKELIPYYESGERVEIAFSYGEVKRGTIGITSGWRPIFLLMLTKRSIGSSYTIHEQDKIVKIIK